MYEIYDLEDVSTGDCVILTGIDDRLFVGVVRTIDIANGSVTIKGSSLDYHFDGGKVAVVLDEDVITANVKESGGETLIASTVSGRP